MLPSSDFLGSVVALALGTERLGGAFLDTFRSDGTRLSVCCAEMKRQTNRAEGLCAELARITVIFAQAAAAIVAPLSGWLAAHGSNSVFQVANFHDLAADWHGFRLRFEEGACHLAGMPARSRLAAPVALE